ncbi:GNAT family N-acetyltransferase [Asticcacaulis solisilvae]|uniref:GNAT family N-acetyltransferase n=1 Tax=Asticcacaulis solisilvae TaxID=1217274 RepID=UPI003FD8A287
MKIEVRDGHLGDFEALFHLYREVAAVPGGLLRREAEVSPDYIRKVMENSLARGVSVVAIDEDRHVVGELHGWVPNIRQLFHVMSDLTIAISPCAQGQGVGRLLFAAFLGRVRERFGGVERVELFCRADNARAIALYRSQGFVEEGRLVGRVKDERGFIADDLLMALRFSAVSGAG